MKKNFEKLSKMYLELVGSEALSFNEVAGKKNITGVYIIYSPEREVLYIGSTNKFHIRYGTDLKHESTHTLVRKFLKREVFTNRNFVLKYLSNQCTHRIHICSGKREAEALEHFAIWTLDPKYNK